MDGGEEKATFSEAMEAAVAVRQKMKNQNNQPTQMFFCWSWIRMWARAFSSGRRRREGAGAKIRTNKNVEREKKKKKVI